MRPRLADLQKRYSPLKRLAVLFAILLLCFLALPNLALADDKACEADSKQSHTTCQTQSLDGMDPSAQSLSDEIDASNASTSSIGNNTANQCQNQKDRSNKLSSLAKKKADACRQFAGKCSDSCEKAAKEHDQKAQAAKAQEDTATENKEKQRAKEMRAKAQTCKADGARASEMDSLGDSQDKNAGTNSNCQQQQASQPQQDQKPEDKKKDNPSAPPSPASVTPPTDCSIASNAGVSGCPGVGKPTNTGLNSSGAPGSSSPSLKASANGAKTPSGVVDAGGGTPITMSTSGGGGGGSGSGGGFGSGSQGSAKSVQIGKSELQKSGLQAGGGGVDGGGGGGGIGGGGRGRAENDVDLSQYMLNKKNGVAGMSLKPVDGITGPTGKTLFEKVSTQYQLQRAIFIPEGQ